MKPKAAFSSESVCQGTSHGLVARGDWKFRYEQYKDLYTNCTYLVGNLEIIFLDEMGKTFDLSFLSSIKQVTGYVLIVGVFADYLHLDNLQIIRGKTLFYYPKNNDHYTLFVALNYDKNSPTIGLKELRFTSLREILAGKIFFMNNNQLCFENAVNWKDVNPYVTPPVEFRFNSSDYRRPCDTAEECDPVCYNNITHERNCWGGGKDMCQELTQGEACHRSCERRCYGKLPNQCCHQECAGGCSGPLKTDCLGGAMVNCPTSAATRSVPGECSGPLKTDCLACRNFLDDGACVPFCPPSIIYDNRLMMNIPNLNAKYAYGGICVKQCPGFLLQDAGSCVRACPEGKYPKDGKNCVPCEGPCPRTCKGTEGSQFLNAANLNNFTDCTTIDGNLRILKHSFLLDQHFNISPLHPQNLTVLKHVREITGFLLIQSDHPDFTDLSFLSSLEIINGRQLDGGQALHILGTPLKSLDLTSLRRIANGNVYILGNPHLCYAYTIAWRHLFDTSKQKPHVSYNKSPNNCTLDDEVCDPQCSSEGCWGKGPNRCLKCLMYEFPDQHLCLNNCSDVPLLYHAGEQKCQRCHSECASSCTGPENTQCDQCAHVAIHGPGGQVGCFAKCPKSMYSDSNNVCRPCHLYCESFGCTGPSEQIKDGGCNKCEVGLQRSAQVHIITCLPADTESCMPGYYMNRRSLASPGAMAGQRVCEPCHHFCATCHGASNQYCEKCRYFRSLDNYCTDSCPRFTYGDEQSKQCRMCHRECRGGCTGPDSTDCNFCSNFKIYMDEELTVFNCTAECPDTLPYQVKDVTQDDENRNVCADESHPEVRAMLDKDRAEEKKKIIILVVLIIGGVLILGVLLTLFGYYCQKRAKSREKTAELTARMTGFDETEPVTPTNAQPDLAKLRLVKESELRKGGIIGSGAFGTVYKGFWIPQGENVKIPVAIKVLQDGTSPNQNKELLEEARVMASVEQACCIRILAVCMSAQMMLITQLMPLGCLLDYVRKNKEHIGSRVLLNWCTQIAKGMGYLEERGIVHRDLAARNVLVQTPTQVKITDFGLAKLLDYNEDEYHAAGGKMPIKWLALECIQHRIFTHKSDVWSFGVTAWELFTYGQKPYDNIRARDVPGLLEKGERLPQPSICTIDVYMIMIKCWMLDAESRPSFKELTEEFAKMARDPGRYLVVQGDVLKKIPEENFHGSDLDLLPIDGVDLPTDTEGEGDKLMRLPSHSYDKSELVRSVSVAADGPEELVEADDYLQPHLPQLSPPRQVVFENNNSPSTPLLIYPVKPDKLDCGGCGAGSSSGGPPWRERNYAHLDAAVARKQRQQASPTRAREDSFNSRYSSDPIHFFREKEEIEGVASYPAPHHSAVLHNGGMRMPSRKSSPPQKILQLPVDEDNYLAPHAAISQPSAMYTDLSDKGYYQNEKVFDESQDQRETDYMLGSSAKALSMPAVANPEYFGQDNDNDDDDDVWETKPLHNGQLPPYRQPHPPQYHRGKSLDVESHYYNDFNAPHGSAGIVPGGSLGRVNKPFREQLPSESRV
ncbi:hypothetical protein ACOMHN_040213 [Nucella lapillus]